MTTKDVLELRRRFTKEACTFTRMCGCYVDADRNKITTFNETFLNLDDEEFYKYLEIVKSMFKGKIAGKLGDNLLPHRFADDQSGPGTMAAQLLQLRGDMRNEEALDAFYDMVIDSYDYTGNYLILLFHDAYDVMTRTYDNNEVDESEEVYEYLICAICPVGLTSPGLGYREDENRIAPRIRDWVVGMPDTGFLYPAFTDRKEDREQVLFYTKDAADPHHELMEYGLECAPELTGTEKRMKFEKCIEEVMGKDVLEEILMDVNMAMWDMPAETDVTAETYNGVVDSKQLEKLLTAADVLSDTCKLKIVREYEKAFRDGYPEGRWLFNKKYYNMAVNAAEKRAVRDLLESAAQELERTEGDSGLTKRIRAAVTR